MHQATSLAVGLLMPFQSCCQGEAFLQFMAGSPLEFDAVAEAGKGTHQSTRAVIR
jgi:hypothetical protein